MFRNWFRPKPRKVRMTEESFVAFLMPHGLTEAQARNLWAARPNGSNWINQEGLLETTKKFVPVFEALEEMRINLGKIGEALEGAKQAASGVDNTTKLLSALNRRNGDGPVN